MILRNILILCITCFIFSCSSNDDIQFSEQDTQQEGQQGDDMNNDDPGPSSVCDTNENVYVGDVILETQEEVNNFGAGDWCSINGKLSIGFKGGPNGNILDLTPLQGLKTVRSLFIYNNAALESLDGLNDLEILRGSLLIYNNYELLNINALERLTTAPGKIEIQWNPLLGNIDGLRNITSDVQEILIDNNPSLRNIDGLIGIKNVVPQDPNTNENGSNITIRGQRLENIEGLSNLKRVEGGFTISTSSENINALENLQVVKKNLSIFAPNIQHVDALSNFTEIPDKITITGASITNLDGISGFDTIEWLVLQSLSSLSSLEALSSFSSVRRLEIHGLKLVENFEELSHLTSCSWLEIKGNESIENLSGLSNLQINGSTVIEIIGNDNLIDISDLNFTNELGTLNLSSNQSLTSFDGVGNITRINGVLAIRSNESVTSMADFENLSHLNWLLITDNKGLISLDGLENLNVLSRFQVNANIDLVDYCAVRNLFLNGNFNGSYFVNGNTFNPTQQDIIDGNCSQ
jgi:hypothetical protein